MGFGAMDFRAMLHMHSIEKWLVNDWSIEWWALHAHPYKLLRGGALPQSPSPLLSMTKQLIIAGEYLQPTAETAIKT